jgi:hypothetical protein
LPVSGSRKKNGSRKAYTSVSVLASSGVVYQLPSGRSLTPYWVKPVKVSPSAAGTGVTWATAISCRICLPDGESTNSAANRPCTGV